jgi:hypothetical protein
MYSTRFYNKCRTCPWGSLSTLTVNVSTAQSFAQSVSICALCIPNGSSETYLHSTQYIGHKAGIVYHFAKLVVAPGRSVGYLGYSCMHSYIRHHMEDKVQIHGTAAVTPAKQPLLCSDYVAM